MKRKLVYVLTLVMVSSLTFGSVIVNARGVDTPAEVAPISEDEDVGDNQEDENVDDSSETPESSDNSLEDESNANPDENSGSDSSDDSSSEDSSNEDNKDNSDTSDESTDEDSNENEDTSSEDTSNEEIDGESTEAEEDTDKTSDLTVSGNEISLLSLEEYTEWSDFKFEEMNTPSEGTSLIYSDSFDLDAVSSDDGYIGFVLSEGSYKILSYDLSVIYGYSTATGVTTGDDITGDTGHEYTYETLVTYDNPVDNSLEDILANEVVRSTGSYFKTCTNTEGYVLFFSNDATSINDLQFVCKISDLAKYSVGRSSSADSSASTTATSTVSLVKKIYDADTSYCTTAKYKVNFSLGNARISGVDIEEKALCIVIDNNYNFSLNNLNSGEVEFELRNLENKTYNYYIKSSNGYKYEGSFNVDFVKVSGSDVADLSDSDISVSFSGQPSSAVKGTQVTMKMNTNVNCMMNFNGKVLGNSAYGTSFEFTVTQNGEYYYAASSASGKTAEGKFVVDFFTEEEPVVLDDAASHPLTDVSTDSSLIQTGYGYNVFFYIVAGLAFLSGVALLLDRKFHFLGKIKGGVVNVFKK